ncbi:MAG TPA: serine/threonine-protein kinase [Ktedonobacterales bacterium]|nr:serine/threonine-protein kinase [Ktedonobacterales bacterium]
MPQPTQQDTLAKGVMLDGRYRIEKLIGNGGYASVYKALDTTHNVVRAIKEVTDPDKGVQEQFRLEADLLITYHHPNIPRGYYVFQANKRIYFVMDYVDGKDLEELLNESLTQQRRPLDEGHVLRWAIAICGALSQLHGLQKPIIHRDIKPANIKITPDDRPVLIDFGLAKLQQGTPGHPSASATQVAAQGVSPGFAPPEQYMAKGRTDAKTDIYGLGATLYACLTGRDPAEAPARLLAQTGVTHGASLDEPRKLNSRITRPTEAVILKALELSPSRRQQTAGELERELRDALDQFTAATSAGSTVVMPPSVASKLDQSSARRPAVAPQAPPPPQQQRSSVMAMLTPGRQAAQRGAPLKAVPQMPTTPAMTPAAVVDQRSAKHAAVQAPMAPPIAAAGAAVAGSAGALNRQAPPAPLPTDTGMRRTIMNAQSGAPVRSSGKHKVPPLSAMPAAAPAQAPQKGQPLVATDTAQHPVLKLKPSGGATAATAAVTSAGVAVAEKGQSGKQKRISAKGPAVAPAAPKAAPKVDPRSWIHTGTTPITNFGKWMLAISAIEALWGAAALTAGIVSVVNHGLPTALLLKLVVGWLVIVAAVSIYGGQALNRPVYRRGRLGSVRRAMQGTGLFFFSVLVHLVALWGATIFIATPGNQTLAVIAYTVFGVNVLVAGVLSVYNILD